LKLILIMALSLPSQSTIRPGELQNLNKPLKTIKAICFVLCCQILF
jgi:hypothetical protein